MTIDPYPQLLAGPGPWICAGTALAVLWVWWRWRQ